MCEFIPPSCVVAFCVSQHRRSCVLMLRRWYPRHLPIFICRRGRMLRNGNKGTSNVKSGDGLSSNTSLTDHRPDKRFKDQAKKWIWVSSPRYLDGRDVVLELDVPLALADCRICLGSWSTGSRAGGGRAVVFDCKTIQGFWQGSQFFK